MNDPIKFNEFPLFNKTAIICGGSKGIGKATASELVQLGCNVCLIARGKNDLEAAKEELEHQLFHPDQFIQVIAADTTNIEVMRPLLDQFIKDFGTPDYLINNVGFALPKYVLDFTLEDFKAQMDTNYYGQLVPTLLLIPYFKAAHKGHIAFVSSLMGFFGIIGYAAYAPTKFAIVGLAETLRHELKPDNITFSILFPPDTDTPGFEIENQTKPPECAMMSENAKLLQPEDVAAIFVRGLRKKDFYILPGEGRMIWFLSRWFPRIFKWIIDNDYANARKKIRLSQ